MKISSVVAALPLIRLSASAPVQVPLLDRFEACSPVRLTFAPGEAAARASLPDGARLSWSSSRETPASVFGLALPVNGSCASVLEALPPPIFRVDPSEWSGPASGCESGMVKLTRRSIGGREVESNDVLTGVVQGGVLTGVVGFYSPVAESSAPLEACEGRDLPAARLEASLRGLSIPFTVFESCIPVARGSHAVKAQDQVRVESVRWASGEGPGELRRVRPGAVEISLRHASPELLGSNLFCDLGGEIPPSAGALTLQDAVSGELIGVKNGLNCQVC
jgi:hypothetical protein